MQHQPQQGQHHLSDFEKDKHRITTKQPGTFKGVPFCDKDLEKFRVHSHTAFSCNSRLLITPPFSLSILWAKPSLNLSRSVSSGPQAPKLGTDLGYAFISGFPRAFVPPVPGSSTIRVFVVFVFLGSTSTSGHRRRPAPGPERRGMEDRCLCRFSGVWGARIPSYGL